MGQDDDNPLVRMVDRFKLNDRIFEEQLGAELKSYKYVHENNDRLKKVVEHARTGLRTYIEMMEPYIEHVDKGGKLEITDKEEDKIEEFVGDLTSMFTLMKSAYHSHLRLECLNVAEEIKGMLPAIKRLRILAKELGQKGLKKELKGLAKDEDIIEEEMDALRKAGEDLFHASETINRFDNSDIHDIEDIRDNVKVAKEVLVSLRSNYKIITTMLDKVDSHLMDALSAGEHALGENKKLHDLLVKYAEANPDVSEARTFAAKDLKDQIRRDL